MMNAPKRTCLTAAMVKEYEQGHTLAIIAERHNKPVTTVSKRLREAGVAMRPRGRPSKRTPATRRAATGKDADATVTAHAEGAEGHGLYTIALQEGKHGERHMVVQAFFRQERESQITFHSFGVKDARRIIRELDAMGYRCELVARALGCWCQICHGRAQRGWLCDWCMWLCFGDIDSRFGVVRPDLGVMQSSLAFPNAFGMCAADGERSLAKALGLEVVRLAKGYRVRLTREAVVCQESPLSHTWLTWQLRR